MSQIVLHSSEDGRASGRPTMEKTMMDEQDLTFLIDAARVYAEAEGEPLRAESLSPDVLAQLENEGVQRHFPPLDSLPGEVTDGLRAVYRMVFRATAIPAGQWEE